MSPLCFGSDRSCCCSLFQKRQWNQCMQGLSSVMLLTIVWHKAVMAQCAVPDGGGCCTRVHCECSYLGLTQDWPHSLLVTINVLFLTFPVFIKALCVCWTPPCPRIRQSSQVWLHLTVWPGAAPLSSSLCNLLCSTVSYFSVSDYSAVGLS